MMAENPAISPQALAAQIKAHPFGDAGIAIAVLEDPDVAEVYSASTSTFPAKHWLETYRVSFGQMAKKAKVHGGDVVLQALENCLRMTPFRSSPLMRMDSWACSG